MLDIGRGFAFDCDSGRVDVCCLDRYLKSFDHFHVCTGYSLNDMLLEWAR